MKRQLDTEPSGEPSWRYLGDQPVEEGRDRAAGVRATSTAGRRRQCRAGHTAKARCPAPGGIARAGWMNRCLFPAAGQPERRRRRRRRCAGACSLPLRLRPRLPPWLRATREGAFAKPERRPRLAARGPRGWLAGLRADTAAPTDARRSPHPAAYPAPLTWRRQHQVVAGVDDHGDAARPYHSGGHLGATEARQDNAPAWPSPHVDQRQLQRHGPGTDQHAVAAPEQPSQPVRAGLSVAVAGAPHGERTSHQISRHAQAPQEQPQKTPAAQ